MAVWVVRAGRRGRQEEAVLQSDFAAIGWNELPDLSKVEDRETLRTIYQEAIPNETEQQLANQVGQVWAFLKKIVPGDLVVLPRLLKSRRAEVAIGKVTGPYRFRSDLDEELHHTLPVQWLRKDIPRTSFDQDIQESLGIPLTVYRVSRNSAEQRMESVLRGGMDPGPGTVTQTHIGSTTAPRLLTEAIDAVRALIAQHQGKDLSEENTKTALINPILCALGWHVGNLDEVSQEYRRCPQDNPVDYALLLDGNPQLLVEAKALGPGLTTKGDHVKGEQIMGYAGNVGVTWVVLTNGDEYRIYNATVPVPLEQKLFRAVRLSDPSSPTEETLALLSKERIDGLEERWQSHFADRKVRAAIEGLFSPEPHPTLLSFIKKEVAGLTPTQIKASLSRICPKIKIP
jgi:hypothetical protein